jgi:hypothetical protein
VLFISQNGESWLIDSNGQDASPHLPQFQVAAFVQQVRAPRETSFYTRHARGVERVYLLALLAVLAGGWGRKLWRLLRRNGAS